MGGNIFSMRCNPMDKIKATLEKLTSKWVTKIRILILTNLSLPTITQNTNYTKNRLNLGTIIPKART
jgi:hypothetical protein